MRSHFVEIKSKLFIVSIKIFPTTVRFLIKKEFVTGRNPRLRAIVNVSTTVRTLRRMKYMSVIREKIHMHLSLNVSCYIRLAI